jgi:hypothetical protein
MTCPPQPAVGNGGTMVASINFQVTGLAAWLSPPRHYRP